MATEIQTLKDLYTDHLKDLYSAENQITKALPKIIKKVASPELKRGLETHLQETMHQIERLDQIFSKMDASPRGKKCVGMEGVLGEGAEVLDENMASEDLRDAALIAACQKVEHYEIASYGSACVFAKMLGETDAASLLNQTLEEEKAADRKLTQVGMTVVNPDAMQNRVNTSMKR